MPETLDLSSLCGSLSVGVFSKVRRNWSATDSIIHAYATLLLLSFGILNHNILQLLKSTNMYNSTGKVYSNVLVNRPSIHMYSSIYIPYLIIVLTLMFFLGVCPIALLCIYSIKLCRRELNNCCSHRIEIALNTFVDTFQGTFKDGLNGTRDYRISPALFLILVICCTLLGTFGHVFNVNTMLFLGVVLVLTSFLIAYVHPCKSFVTNLSLSFHMFLSATIGTILDGQHELQDFNCSHAVSRYCSHPSCSDDLLGHTQAVAQHPMFQTQCCSIQDKGC